MQAAVDITTAFSLALWQLNLSRYEPLPSLGCGPNDQGLDSRAVAYPGIFFGGGSTNSVEDRGQRERGSGGGSPLVRGSGGSCNLVQEISFLIVKFS